MSFVEDSLASILESTLIEQTQPGVPASSMIKLFALEAQAGLAQSTTLYDVINGSTWSALQSTLSATWCGPSYGFSYCVDGSDDLTPVGQFVNQYGIRVVVPQNGGVSIGQWQGAGYWLIAPQAGGIALGTYLTGGYDDGDSGNGDGGGGGDGNGGGGDGAGGHGPGGTVASNGDPGAGDPSNTAAGQGVEGAGTTPGAIDSTQGPGVNGNTVDGGDNATASDPSKTSPGASPPNTGATQPTGAYAASLVTGDFQDEHDDISTGAGGFPYQLTFTRSYDSSRFLEGSPTGQGWTHNFAVRTFQDSDTLEALGVNSPVSGVAGIAAIYTALQVVNTQNITPQPAALPLDRVLILALIDKWFSDGVVNNIVSVRRPGQIERFVKLPDGTFNRPMHSSSSLVAGPSPALYTYKTKSQLTETFDSLGNISTWASPAGATIAFSYTNGQLTSVANNLGRTLTLAYDATGKQLQSVADGTTLPDGTARKATYAYDTSGKLTTFTDPNKQPTKYAYDASNRLQSVTYPSYPSQPGVANVYDSLGRVKTQQDANGNTTNLYFAGSRSETDDPASDSHVTYYDPRGNLLVDIDGLGYQTTLSYDGRSRVVRKTLPEGNAFAYTYDGLDNLTQEDDTPKSGSGLAVRTATFQYDPLFNQVNYAQDFDQNVTRWQISSTTGLASSKTDPVPASNTPAVTSCLGQSSNAPTTCFSYSAVGQLEKVTDPIGKVSNYYHNPNVKYLLTLQTVDVGRLNLQATYSYDAVGNISTFGDAYYKYTGFSYDSDRRMTATDIPYDTSSGAARRPKSVGHDADGRTTCTRWQTSPDIPASGSTCPASSNATGAAQTTVTTYTPTGKVLTETDASGRVVTHAYDAVDRALYVKDGAGRVTAWAYDADSRVVQLCQGNAAPTSASCAGETAVEKRTYTPNGLLLTRQHFSAGAWQSTTYKPDGFDRPGGLVTFPDATTEKQSWSAGGDLLSRTSRANQTVTYGYDHLHRKISRSGTWSATYGYDLASHLLSVTVGTSTDGVASGTWSWGYDTAGRLTSEVQPAVSTTTNPIKYVLDLNGARDSTIYPDGAKYYLPDNYDYVRIGGQLTLPGQSTATSLWSSFPDPFDQPILLELLTPSTYYSTRAFDNGGGGLDLASVANGTAAGPTLNYTYSYDLAHHLTGQGVANAAPLPHPSTSNTLAGLTAKANNELVNADPNHTLSYDNNGNLLADGPLSGGSLTVNGTHQYTYATDGSGRLLTATTKGGTSATYQYDPFGRRIAKTVGGVTTRYMFDNTNVEIGEYDSSSNLLRRLLHHPNFAAPIAFADAAGNISYEVTDRLGSVVATVSSSAATTNTYGYLPYGDTPSGTLSGTAFGYAGYRYDAETGIYHTATRSYDPRLGRFLQTDPLGQDGGRNIYAYVGGNPLGKVDPSGKAPNGACDTSCGVSDCNVCYAGTNTPLGSRSAALQAAMSFNEPIGRLSSPPKGFNAGGALGNGPHQRQGPPPSNQTNPPALSQVSVGGFNPGSGQEASLVGRLLRALAFGGMLFTSPLGPEDLPEPPQQEQLDEHEKKREQQDVDNTRLPGQQDVANAFSQNSEPDDSDGTSHSADGDL